MKTLFGILIFGPMVALLLFLLARFLFCGPDKSVEKVAFPLAKVIVEHIEKNGVPYTLNDIEELPYELKCGNSNIREHNSTDYKTKKEYVMSLITTQSCTFMHNEKLFKAYMDVTKGVAFDGIYFTLGITHEKTLVKYEINHKKNQWIYENYPDSKATYGYGKRTGFCSAIRLFQ